MIAPKLLVDPQKLVEIGLTKREAGAYIALLKLEEATAGQVAKLCFEDRTNIYDSLNGLVKKGLANYVIVRGKTHYRVAPPDRLADFLVEKEKTLAETMPELAKIYRSYKPGPSVETYVGKEGIKTVLSDILREGKPFVGFGATDRMFQLFPDFTGRYLREREKQKIRARQFYAEGERVLPSKYSIFKAIPKQFSGPATTLIYGEKVAVLLWFMDPPVAVLIKSRQAADAYRRQFEFMWKMTSCGC